MQYYILYIFVFIVVLLLISNYLYKSHKLVKFKKRDEVELSSLCSEFTSREEIIECVKVCELFSGIINIKPGQIRLSDTLEDLSSKLPFKEIFYDDLEEYFLNIDESIVSSHKPDISNMTVYEFIIYLTTREI